MTQDWVLVPREPTEEMLEAVRSPFAPPGSIYRAMIEAAPPAPGGWMTIETAPKDGTTVLLFGTQRPMDAVHHKGRLIFSGYWDYCDSAWCSLGSTWLGPFYDPTHWQHLPPAPGDEKGKGGEKSASLTGPGSHASHEAPSDLRPAGVDPIAHRSVK